MQSNVAIKYDDDSRIFSNLLLLSHCNEQSNRVLIWSCNVGDYRGFNFNDRRQNGKLRAFIVIFYYAVTTLFINATNSDDF